MERKALFGFFIIIMALGATILIGFALNVDQSTETKTDYDLVTDVTGLYEFSDQEQYIDYTPPSNYNGYSKKTDAETTTLINEPKSGVRATKLDTQSNTYIKYTNSTNELQVRIDGITNITHPDKSSAGNAIFFCDKYYFQPGGWYGTPTSVGSYSTFEIYLKYDNQCWVFINTQQIYKTTTLFQYAFVYNNDGDYSYIGANFLSNINNPTYAIGNDIYGGGDSSTAFFNGSNASYITSNTANGYDTSSYRQYNMTTDTHQSSRIYAPYSITLDVSINGSGIAYTESATANNYPIGTASSTTTSTATLTSSLPQQTPQGTYAIMLGSTNDTTTFTSYVLESPYVTTATNLINSLNIPSGTTDVKITAGGSTFATSPNNNYYSNTTVFFDNWGSSAFYDTGVFGNSTWQDRYIVCHISSSTADLYRSGSLVGTYPMGSLYIAYGGTPYAIVSDYYYNIQSKTPATLTPTPTSTVNLEYNVTTYKYIKISEGISINNTSNVYYTEWTNAPYTNSDIQILFRATNTGQIYTNTITTSNGDVITVSTDGTTTNVKINSGETVDVGHWRTFILDIDGLNGNVSVIPVKDFGTFTQYNTYDTSISVGAIDKGTITGLKWDSTTSSFKFLIVKTTVFMNTYGAVMVDPSIDISDYFTDLNDEYRLNYYSFALYGDAMTINGTEYTVENGRISIDDTEHALRNIYITYNDGHTYITFNEDNTVLDLGETTDYTISFDGTWYFTNTLYKGYEKTETVYNWHWDGFNISWDSAILVFVGLSAVGCAYCAKHHMINTIGIIIVIVSGVCAISLIGGLI